ncbi:hypothetical protein BDZ45DRAFT_743256 [Acephala macrosclerotiorum]|nr:hypothetical protein BDZ45DRAFT_743256 [Acephala macrosclerotiorum]
MLDQVDCDYEQLIVQLGTLAGHLDDELPVSETTLPGNLAACSSDVSDRLGNSSEQSSIHSQSRGRSDLLQPFNFPMHSLAMKSSSVSDQTESSSQHASDTFGHRFPAHTKPTWASGDQTFWAATAPLLGPDFDVDTESIKNLINSAKARHPSHG